jgi:hypothetical protein
MLYRSLDAGRVEVFLQAFPGSGSHWQISTNGGGEPSWRKDGKELYFLRDNQLFAVDFQVTAAGVKYTPPKLLFAVQLTEEIRRNRYVPAPDGQRFLMVARGEQQGQLIRIVLNWQAGLNRR